MILDFTGSEELIIENQLQEESYKRVIESMVRGSGHIQTIASVREMPHSKMHWELRWNRLQLHLDVEGDAQLTALCEKAKRVFMGKSLDDMTLQDIEKHLSENLMKHFIDPEFLPVIRGEPETEWKRLSEIEETLAVA